MSSTRTRTIKHPAETERYTVWDNLEMHLAALQALGATEADVAPLREAARAVAEEEASEAREQGRNPALDRGGLAGISAPHTCVNGWVVQPPTLWAKRWATAAMYAVTGGREPEQGVGLAYAILAALWALKMAGEGRGDAVMQAVCGAGRLAELLPSLEDDCGDCDLTILASDYTVLMGIGKKNSPARLAFETTANSILKKFSAPLTSESSGSSPRPEPPLG